MSSASALKGGKNAMLSNNKKTDAVFSVPFQQIDRCYQEHWIPRATRTRIPANQAGHMTFSTSTIRRRSVRAMALGIVGIAQVDHRTFAKLVIDTLTGIYHTIQS